jgi:beta-lactamase class C
MRLIKKLSTGWLLFACAASFNSYAMPSARKADMDAVVKNAAEDAMRQHGIPGLAIAIAAGGELWFYSYGVASKKTEQKITEDTIFEIGSVSKTFTATLAT